MSTIVEVVSGDGADWAAIAAAGATVVAAIGGIWGTARQARRGREAATDDLKKSLAAATEDLRLGINAENARIRRGEKRQIYARFLATVNIMIPAIGEVAVVVDKASKQLLARHRDVVQARFDMLTALMELELVAPDEVARHAKSVASKLGSMYDEILEHGDLSSESPQEGPHKKLLNAMRADLEGT